MGLPLDMKGLRGDEWHAPWKRLTQHELWQ